MRFSGLAKQSGRGRLVRWFQILERSLRHGGALETPDDPSIQALAGVPRRDRDLSMKGGIHAYQKATRERSLGLFSTGRTKIKVVVNRVCERGAKCFDRRSLKRDHIASVQNLTVE